MYNLNSGTSSNPFFLYLIYFLFFGSLVIFSVLINRLFLKFSNSLGIRNLSNDNVIRWGATSKPAFGGISFYILFLLSISFYNLLPISEENFLNKDLIGLLLATSLGFLIGLADDAYNTNPLFKFIGQFQCANILIFMNVIIDITPFSIFN